MKPQIDTPVSASPPVLPPVAALEPLAAVGVELIEGEQVRDYLSTFADLANLLPQICQAARTEFGWSAELSLALYRDPEFTDQYLTLYVRLPAYDPDIAARLDRVSAGFEDKLAQQSGHVLLTTDFRSPRRAHGF